jgi:DNA-directed RNA polymerase specialized sigma24 family protein
VCGLAALVLSECRRVTGNSHDAEDASQLAFLALAIEIKSGTAIRSPGSWLARVARRQASKIVRARGRLRRREDAARRNELHVSNGESALDAAVTSGIVRDAIDRLP